MSVFLGQYLLTQRLPYFSHAAAAAAVAQEAAKRAAADAAAHRAALIAMPLWQHGVRCASAIAVGLGASILVSRELHKQADKVQAGEVRELPVFDLLLKHCISMTADGNLVGAPSGQEVCTQSCMHCRGMINTEMHPCMTQHCPA